MYILVLQRLLVEALWDIGYFPLWWYTLGAKRALLWCWDFLKLGNRNLAPGLWLRNIFVPMYGQYDWQGRIISFFMRSVQILARMFALLMWLILSLFLWIIWLALPIIVVSGFFVSLRS